MDVFMAVHSASVQLCRMGGYSDTSYVGVECHTKTDVAADPRCIAPGARLLESPEMPDRKPQAPTFDPQMLVDLAQMEMPFGRYRGRLLIDLPEPYVVWFRKQGFPRGRLGLLLGLLYEIKANGLEELVRPLGKGGAHEVRRAGS